MSDLSNQNPMMNSGEEPNRNNNCHRLNLPVSEDKMCTDREIYRNTSNDPKKYLATYVEQRQYADDASGMIFLRKPDKLGLPIGTSVAVHSGEEMYMSNTGEQGQTEPGLDQHMTTQMEKKSDEDGLDNDCDKLDTLDTDIHRYAMARMTGSPCNEGGSGELVADTGYYIQQVTEYRGGKKTKEKYNSKLLIGSCKLDQSKKKNKGDKPYQCNICGNRFTLCNSLKKHLMIHTGEKPYECKICGSRFIQCGTLKVHLMKHTGEKPFECDICGQRFTRSRGLDKHRMIHTGEMPHECEICGNKFSRYNALKTHLMTHTGEKPFSCEICSRRFCQSSDLNRHLRTHTGEKPYKCEVCGKSFSQLCTLRRHSGIHTGEKPYECDIESCGKKFNQQSSLKRHRKTHETEIKEDVASLVFVPMQEIDSDHDNPVSETEMSQDMDIDCERDSPHECSSIVRK